MKWAIIATIVAAMASGCASQDAAIQPVNITANDFSTFTDTDGTVYSVYDSWTHATFNFAGVAKSFDLSAAAGVAGFDNMTINAVPEPESYALGLVGLGLVGALARRRQAA